MKCKIENCGRKVAKEVTHGLCWYHRNESLGLFCIVDGCEEPRRYTTDSYCNKHDLQFRRHGKILERTRFDSNDFIIEDDICKIILFDKNGEAIKIALIDVDDLKKVKKNKWSYSSSNNTVVSHINKKFISLHRFLLNPEGNEEIDHINMNRLDNRRCNLRQCNRSQNGRNRPLQSNNTSGLKGVSFFKRTGKWCSYINHNNKKIHLGFFYTAEEAGKKYDEAAIKYHGEFARTNKMLGLLE